MFQFPWHSIIYKSSDMSNGQMGVGGGGVGVGVVHGAWCMVVELSTNFENKLHVLQWNLSPIWAINFWLP